MARIYIVHRWDGDPEGDWYQWLRRELRDLGHEVHIPLMPNPAEPKIETWVNCLNTVIVQPDAQTFFVGHSIGCQTILRYLEQLSADTRVGGAVLVAPWLTLTNLESPEVHDIAAPWLETPIDFKKVKKHTERFAVLFSDDDYFVPKDNQKVIAKKLAIEPVVEHAKGHFTSDDDVTELPSVLEQVKRLISA